MIKEGQAMESTYYSQEYFGSWHTDTLYIASLCMWFESRTDECAT